MDPRNRLWLELIFPHCASAPELLLALRAACRDFLAQLNAAPANLWVPLTMLISRMNYAERTMGWQGVAVAMERERRTRANCDAGRFTPGAAIDAPYADIPDKLLLVCGRLVTRDTGNVVRLFDCDTGAPLAAFADFDFHATIVADRWVVLHAVSDNSLVLLDCATAKLTPLAPAPPVGAAYRLVVAGLCVSFRANNELDTTFVHISGRPDGTTAVRLVPRVTLSSDDCQLVLCRRGRSYVLFDGEQQTLQLCDTETGRPTRTYIPRTALLLRLLSCLTRAQRPDVL